MTELARGDTALAIDGDIVQITIRCKNHYEAILLYDKMVSEGEKGGILLKMTTHTKPKVESL
jgi:hypothetical protein